VALREREWHELAMEVKAKRTKTSIDNSVSSVGDSILSAKELTVQILATEPTGTFKKYVRLGLQEFVEFEANEVSIESLKKACNKHFKGRIPAGMECDVLASERGPSCSKIAQN